MAAGSLTLACLLLAVNGGAEAGEQLQNFRQFNIPIVINPDKKPDISALELHWSKNRGEDWEMLARISPDKTGYPCTVPSDGPYWFTLVTINAQNQRDVTDLKKAKVGLKVYVDTVPPEIKLTAERRGDEIVVNWDIREEHLDPKSLKVEWVQSGQPAVLAPVTAGLHGQTRFKPGDPMAAVRVSMSAADLAENKNQAVSEVAAQQISPPGTVVSTDLVRPPLQPPDHLRTADAVPPPWQPGPTPVPPTESGPPGMPTVLPPSGTQRVVALSSGAGAAGSAMTEYPVTQVNNQLPPLQIVNKAEIKLDFDVAKYGPSGLGGVDVYVSLDDGRKWEQAPVDPGAAILPVDGRGPGPLRGSVTVQLNKEGIPYGFYLVVKNKAGLGKAKPRPGDLPQLRVELDTTAPYAELIKPEPDQGQPNAVVMRWKATDLHLGANPVSLQWAPTKDGPWQFIGAQQMPNTGFHVWRLTNDIPASVFLRLTVRDTAGNTAVAETNEPVFVDMTVPVLGGISLQTGPR